MTAALLDGKALAQAIRRASFRAIPSASARLVIGMRMPIGRDAHPLAFGHCTSNRPSGRPTRLDL